MKIVFIGNLQGPGNNSGEEPDERHIVRDLQALGHEVIPIPRDEIHAFYTGAKENNIPDSQTVDVILLCKWSHFTPQMIQGVRERFQAPIVYWTWDFMWQYHKVGHPEWTPDWHRMLLSQCDLYLSGEIGLSQKFQEMGIRYQYFNWDTADGKYDRIQEGDLVYDVVFPGTFIPHSHRNDVLREVQKRFRLKILSWDFETWQREGFDASPGKYGGDFREISSTAKIILCMNWINPRKESVGYWSNRIGKVLTTGGFALVEYVPLLERVVSGGAAYFTGADDCCRKIEYYLSHDRERTAIQDQGYRIGRERFTTLSRMNDLVVVLEQYLATR